MPDPASPDPYSPEEIARRVEEVGVHKVKARWSETYVRSLLAGGCIGLGGLYVTIIAADTTMGLAPARILQGLFFASGYLVALLAGTELFTTNNLLAMAWASGRIRFRRLLANWGVVILGNGTGALAMTCLLLGSGLLGVMDGAVGESAYAMGAIKGELTPLEIFTRAVLGNLFVCVGAWIIIGARSVTDKVLGSIFPLSALGALQLEHVAASFYYLPRSWIIERIYPQLVLEGLPSMDISWMVLHLLLVVAGNIVGGTLMVVGAYYFLYRRHAASAAAGQRPRGTV